MELDWIKDLQRLADTGNFSRAANYNNLSQSAFSRRIQALERWAATSLVDRSSHPVQLTPEGEQFLEVGSQALIHFELMRDQIRHQANNDESKIIFAAQHAIGWRFYPQWLNQFEQQFGSFKSRLLADNLPDCFAALLNHEADFVLGFESKEYKYMPAQRRKIQRRIIGHDRLIPVCLVDQSRKAIFSFKSSSIPLLNYPQNAPLGLHLQPILARTSLGTKLKLSYENSMTESLRMRARNGDGVAWLPETLVKPDIERNLLTVMSGKKFIVKLDICLYRYIDNNNELAEKIWMSLF